VCQEHSPLPRQVCLSVRIPSGTPAVYKLTTKMETTENGKRVTFGEKNVNKVNKTILLVGETGSGKSTVINVLINYAIGVRWEDEVWFEIVQEDKKKRRTESQTSDVIVYEIFGFEDQTLPYSLTIIDTPGFGDTRGIERDDMIRKSLLDLFQSKDGVHEVHLVGLVMKASDNRLSDRLRYIFDGMMSLFGNDLDKNIVALITHSNGRIPKIPLQAIEEAKIKCAKNEKNQPVYFLFDNCQNEDRTEDTEHLQHAENLTMTGVRDFTAFLETAAPRKVVISLDVLNERIRLTASIQNLQEKIKLTELKQAEIRQTQEALKKHEEEMKKNQKFTVEVDEPYKEKKSIDGGMWLFFYEGAVCCTVCEENCHYPGCSMAWYPKHCEVIKKGHCTVCTGKCPTSAHVKERWRYETKTRKVKKTEEEIKEKYEKNKTDHKIKSSLLEILKREMKQLTAEKKQLLDESYQHVVSLEQIALKADSASTIVHLDFLVEKMKDEGDTEKVQKLEEMRSRVDEVTRGAARYMTLKPTTGGKQ
uniref:Septin-type G domain-containing protein n=1 Tax=Amphilophus citrinellus TaxID=61819 RepID=A0A3Q0R3W4_AMPCI